MTRRHTLAFAAFALAAALLITRYTVEQPFFTDAFYYYNAAERLVTGAGLTDMTLWTYIAAPPSLPAPSHLYWMPLSSLVAALGMWLGGTTHAAAQLPFALAYAAAAVLAFYLGGRIGGTARHAWLAGLLVIFSGFYLRFWGTTASFALYALVGGACLAALGGLRVALHDGLPGARLALVAGALAALGHLARADGLLLLMVGVALVTVGGAGAHTPLRRPMTAALLMVGAYGLVLLPWFARNLAAIGTPLPTGGAAAVWFTEYNDLFRYPPDASAADFLTPPGAPAPDLVFGIGRFAATRWEALSQNALRFVGEQGWIILTPFMLIGLWRRRRDPFLTPFVVYALALHVVMTLVFPFPGYRGGLFHSAAALLPFWAALGVVGLDDVIGWAGRRRGWHLASARLVFGVALVVFAVYLSLSVGIRGRVTAGTPPLYSALDAALPADARVMINDPSALYYFTGRGGVVLPDEAPDAVLAIARQYAVGYLVLEHPGATPLPLWTLYDQPPPFLQPLPFPDPTVRLFRIDP